MEGNLKVGTKAGANQRVQLHSLNYDLVSHPPEILVAGMTVQTDAEGKFVFPTVPPGDYWIGIPPEGQSATANVRSGETAVVKLGGMGRPVIGTIVVAGTDTQIDWRRVRPTLKLILPRILMPDSNDHVAVRAWHRSLQGKDWLRAQHSYTVNVDVDGSFRIDDIPEGAYSLEILIPIPDPTQPTQIRRGEVTRQFTVPEMSVGVSDIPLNLGKIIVQ